jgi:protein-tyrosine kinase
MSRIYEALKRAESEQELIRQSAEPSAEPLSVPLRPNNSRDISTTQRMLENIPRRPWKPDIGQLPTLEDYGPGVEEFRSLRSRLHQISDSNHLKSILVSSSLPSEGKSFVSANLAISLTRSRNTNVLLIDADLRRPVLCKVMGCDPSPGLAEYLAGTAEVKQILHRDGAVAAGDAARPPNLHNLTFIPAGGHRGNAAELAGNARFQELMATLSPHFDWIIVDSSPVLTVSDAVNFARTCDSVLLIARGDVTPFDAAQRAYAEFRNSRVLGFVLNAVQGRKAEKSSYGYYGAPGPMFQSERRDQA